MHISSEDIFFKLRGFEGYLDIGEISSDLLLHVDKLNLFRDGKKEFDISIHNSYFRIM